MRTGTGSKELSSMTTLSTVGLPGLLNPEKKINFCHFRQLLDRWERVHVTQVIPTQAKCPTLFRSGPGQAVRSLWVRRGPFGL